MYILIKLLIFYRHVTRSKHIQKTFIELLTAEITLHLDLYRSNVSFSIDKDTVPKIGMCLENFPAGASAVEAISEKLTRYLLSNLQECLFTFR